MKEIEKYILILIALFIASAVFVFLKDMHLAKTYGAAGIPAVAKANWNSITFAIVSLQNIACAFWLRHVSIKNSLSSLTWSCFGLFFGLMAVAIFYLAGIYEHKKT